MLVSSPSMTPDSSAFGTSPNAITTGFARHDFERRVLDRSHAAHLPAAEILGLQIPLLAADAHAEAHVPGAEDLDELALLEPVDQHLVGLRLLEVVHRARRRDDARPDHRHHPRIDRRGLADLHPGHLQVALAHRLERLGDRVERAGEVQARLAAGDHLRQAVLEVLHRDARGMRRRREVGGEAQNDFLRLVCAWAVRSVAPSVTARAATSITATCSGRSLQIGCRFMTPPRWTTLPALDAGSTPG